MTNHVLLILDYWGKLKDLGMVLRWIELSRVEHRDKPEIMETLDRKYQEIMLEKVKIHDEMFEISRSN